MNDISANDNRGIQHFELGPKLTNLLLALNIIGLIVMFVVYRDMDRHVELKRWEYGDFKQNDWPKLEGKVAQLELQVNRIDLTNTVQESCKPRRKT